MPAQRTVGTWQGLFSHTDQALPLQAHQALSSFRLFLLAVQLAWNSSCAICTPPPPATTPDPFQTSKSQFELPLFSPSPFKLSPLLLSWGFLLLLCTEQNLGIMKALSLSVLCLFLSPVPTIVSEQPSSNLIFHWLKYLYAHCVPDLGA